MRRKAPVFKMAGLLGLPLPRLENSALLQVGRGARNMGAASLITLTHLLRRIPNVRVAGNGPLIYPVAKNLTIHLPLSLPAAIRSVQFRNHALTIFAPWV